MTNPIDKLRIIAKAKFSDKSNLGDWYKTRLDICSSCPINSANKESLTLKEKAAVAVNFGKPTCLACNCEIAAKASVRGEQCGLVAKGQEPLWETLPEIQKVATKDLIISNLNSDKVNIIQHLKHIDIDYGTVAHKSDSSIAFKIQTGAGPITKIKTISGCGCTSASSTIDNGAGVINVEYDTVGRIGAARKSLTVYYTAGNKKHVLACKVLINVLK